MLGNSLSRSYEAWYIFCPSASRTPKFWHMYVITYGDFIVIAEPCFLMNFIVYVFNENLLSRVSPRRFWFELNLISEFLKGVVNAWLFFLSGKNNFLCLLSSIWIEWHFPFCMSNPLFLIDHYIKCRSWSVHTVGSAK